ncbi:MAG: acetyl-CoA carboxylase biotin carboxyl carrier protein [Planctomycetota bacterium]|jgi:acetyl-CoA carboxylase biotin carboxyl carrier protein
MALDRIKDLLELMQANDLTELELKEKGFSVRLVKGTPAAPAGPATVVVSGGSHGTHAPVPSPAEPKPAGGAEAQEAGAEGLREITSPIVGTFYRAASPDAEPFVEVGSRVDPDTTICIIEAMKVMNEVKAETSGVVQKVLLENGQPVEFGQPIVLIEPLGA